MQLSFPTKRVSAGALVRNERGELLIVKPSYRDGWLLPGGISERNEPPAATLVREIREELAINVRIARLACIDYLSAHDGYDESVHFLFQCNALTDAEIARIRLPEDELTAFRFCADETARSLVVPSIARRLLQLGNKNSRGGAMYLENGIEPAGT
ncbi:ADP-ribose pyrophosphatase YjhB, NUDIX family [Luteibacter sp. UNC138MFCol5.1]|uniref:NUDIX domain-containing protein n=1 Tax=Luteibacter sp. UNC138MFCol5.1 TaxID=1502774 RepID=UPI0008B48CA2|nr:NUDIX hydrolase [Luteibacter sp. UNC138MFCol5.1]SEP05551.1 ADP-ribose pyrophosphatase YjhB, NUDIX family [Luteibacter sp. UNC138MFCol5.1]